MSEEEIEEQNLDDFLKNASEILCKNDDESKETILESLKEHILIVFKDKAEADNFFTILNGIIFPSNDSDSQNSYNKQPFILYPIIYSFDQKLSFDYIDYFLSALQKSVSEDNKSDFSFLTSVFSNFIKEFYNKSSNDDNNLIDNNNTNLIDDNQKQTLFENLFNFCNNFIKTNKRTLQSFGCLLLVELIENCPLVKEEKNLGNIFKQFSEYLDDRWFECKYDLLNCTISLIFTAEQRFKPYVNVCLFRILDNLTDSDYMKKKLSINILYTLAFYCKEEILVAKDNIIDFLNVLKKDEKAEIREVCLQTLKIIEEADKNKSINNNSNVNNNTNNPNSNYSPLTSEEKKIDLSEDSHSQPSQFFSNNGLERNESSSTNNYNKSKITSEKDSYKKNSYNNNKSKIKNKISNNGKEGLSKPTSSTRTLRVANNNYKDKDYINENNKFQGKSNKKLNNRNNNNQLNTINNSNDMNLHNSLNSGFNNISDIYGGNIHRPNRSTENRGSPNNNSTNYIKKKNSKKSERLLKHDTNINFRDKINKEKLLLRGMDQQINERKMKQSQLSYNMRQGMNSKKNFTKLQNSKNQNQNNKLNINKQKKEEILSSNNNNNNDESNFLQIIEQLKKIQLTQDSLIEIVNNLKDKVEENYSSLDKRITKLENNHRGSRGERQLEENIEKSSSKDINLQNEIIDDKMKIELIKNKYISGKYNEALKEALENDKYLYKLLPLIVSENIIKIDLSIIEDIISKLNFNLPKLCKGEGKNNISIILSFFNQIIRSKINIKLITQMNLKDTLQLIKTDYNMKLSQNDITNIDIVLKTLKV